MSPLILVLVLVSLGLRGVLLAVLVAKRLYHTYIFFLVYLSFSLLSSALRLAMRNHYLAYFYAYWATEAVYTLLSLFVIVEAFSSIFKDFFSNKGFQIILACAGIAILILALLTPIGRHVGVSSVTALILSANLAVGLLQVSTLLVVLGLIVFFNTKGRGYEVGIVVGYGLFASVHLTVLALRSQLGPHYQETVAYAHPIAYIGSVLVWLYAFLWHKGQRRLAQEDLAIGSPGDSPDQLARLTTAYRSFTRKGRIG
jgi:hypothetical protein